MLLSRWSSIFERSMNRESEVGFVAQFSESLFAVSSGIEEQFSTSRVDLKMSGFIFPKKVSSFRMAKSFRILTNSFAEGGFLG
jgi:protease II